MKMFCSGGVGLIALSLLSVAAFGQEPQIPVKVENRVIHLAHVSAVDVAATLARLFGQENGPAIVPGASTNELFVQGSPEKIQEIEEFVRQLDKAPPVIDIDILLLKLIPVEEEGGRPVQLSGTVAEVKATVARLEQAGKAEVVERLHLTTLNNQIAQVQFGRRQPTVQGRTFGGGFPRPDGREGGPRGMAVISQQDVGTMVSAVPRTVRVVDLAGQDDDKAKPGSTAPQKSEPTDAVVVELSIEKSWLQDRAASDEEADDDLPEARTEMQTVSIRATVLIPDGRSVVVGEREITSEGQSSRLAVMVTANVRR